METDSEANAVTDHWCLIQLQDHRLALCNQLLLGIASDYDHSTHGRLGSWKAQAFSLDIWAILSKAPRLTFSEELLPEVLRPGLQLHRTLVSSLQQIQQTAAVNARGAEKQVLYGPWQGGIPAEAAQQAGPTCVEEPFRMAVMNLRGGLGGHQGVKHRLRRITCLIAQLQHERTHVAVLSEPRLGPGFLWPEQFDYVWLGENTVHPDSVGVLVSKRVRHALSHLQGVGNRRAMWLCLEQSPGQQPLLLLAAYGHHRMSPPEIRRQFFEERVWELAKLRATARFANAPVICAGDLNAHLPCLSRGNAPYAGGVEKDIQAILTAASALGLAIRNPAETSTLDAGTALDVLATSPSVGASVYVQPREERTVPSDHKHLFATLSARISIQKIAKPVAVQWSRKGNWEAAMSPFQDIALYMAAWITVLQRSANLRGSTVANKWKGLRATFVNLASWWRTAILILAGHLAGLVVFKDSTRGLNMTPSTATVANWLADGSATNPHLSDMEKRLQEESDLFDSCSQANTKIVQRHAALWHSDHGQADAFLSRLLNPKFPVTLVLLSDDGEELSQSTAIATLTKNLLDRAQCKTMGDTSFNRSIAAEVVNHRRQARQEFATLEGDPISLTDVAAVVSASGSHKTALRFPRAALKTKAARFHLLLWAICNIVAVAGILPDLWLREICPVDKRGIGLVRSLAQIRPISVVDDVESVLDGIWLHHVRPLLEDFMTQQQSGGRYDHLLVVLGLLVTLQSRKAQGLGTLFQVMDLEQGYESIWRDAVRHLARQAHLTSWQWLLLDAMLGEEKLRVRLGPVLGAVVTILHTSIGQGKRSGTHLFGTFATAIIKAVTEKRKGVAMTVPDHVALALSWCRQGFHVQREQCSVAELFKAWSDLRNLPPALQVSYVESTAQSFMPYQQFVDDGFLLCLHWNDLSCANQVITEACHLWRHKFAGGRKGPRVLQVGPMCDSQMSPQNITLCGEQPVKVEQVKVLGTIIDDQLTLEAQLCAVLSTLQSEGIRLVTGMTAAGFGLPAIASQFSTRVVAKAMHGCELLASHVDGFTKVSSRLNHAHYIVAKACLGVPPTTSLGSYVAAFAECRFLTRASTILAQRVVMTRARLALLPRSHPTRVAVRAAQHLPATWWQHARVLMLSISSEFSEIWEFAGASDFDNLTKQGKAKLLQAYRKSCVTPLLRLLEEQWFQQQLQHMISEAIVPYNHVDHVLLPWQPNERWQTWPPTFWNMVRIWKVARIVCALPILTHEGSKFLSLLATCPFCGDVVVGIRHFVEHCVHMQDIRSSVSHLMGGSCELSMILCQSSASVEIFTAKVKLVAGATSRVAQYLQLDTV